jgi:translation initiation factor IF-2
VETIRIRLPNTGGNATIRSARPGFVKGNRPAIVAKVEPKRKLKPNSRNFRKLQGKGGNQKAATEETKEIRNRQRNLMKSNVLLRRGQQTIKKTEFVTVGELPL